MLTSFTWHTIWCFIQLTNKISFNELILNLRIKCIQFQLCVPSHGGIGRRWCVCGAAGATLKPLHLTTPPRWATYGGGRPLRKRLTIFYNMPRTCPRPSYEALITYSCLLTCFEAGSGSSVDHASGGGGGVLASLYYSERMLRQLLPNSTSMYRFIYLSTFCRHESKDHISFTPINYYNRLIAFPFDGCISKFNIKLKVIWLINCVPSEKKNSIML